MLREFCNQGVPFLKNLARRQVTVCFDKLSFLPQCVRHGWEHEGQRRFLFVPVLMGLGIGLYFWLNREPELWTTYPTLAIGAAWVVARYRQVAGYTTILGVALAMWLGFSCAAWRARDIANFSPVLLSETKTLTLVGRIADLEPGAKGRLRVLLDLHETSPKLNAAPKRIRLSLTQQAASMKPGDWIRTRASLSTLPISVSPGSFDFGRKLWFQGVGGTGFGLVEAEIVTPHTVDTIQQRFDGAIQRARHAISEKILASMSPRVGPIAAAFLTGERGLISDEDNQAMRDSSLAHLLSISGLHMVLAGFGIFSALRIAFALMQTQFQTLPTKKISAAIALAISFGYLLLSGASVPTQRSFLTIAVAFVAIICDRTAASMRTVAIAAIVILIATPESWMDPSFQMSFGAVVALVSAYEWWNKTNITMDRSIGITRRIVGLFITTAVTSLIAGTATAPFSAFHFNRLSNYGVIANVLVMPAVSLVIMPFGVLALLLLPFGFEWLPLQAMEIGIERMLDTAHWVSSWPGSTQAVSSFSIESLLLVSIGGLWIALWQANWRWFGIIPICIGALTAQAHTPNDIYISGSGANIAVRDQEGQLKFLSSRRDRFDAEIWLRSDGDSRDIGDAIRDQQHGFSCDDVGCTVPIGRHSNKLLIVVTSIEAALAACAKATVLVDLIRAWHSKCNRDILLIDQNTIHTEGAISVKYSNGNVSWTSVARNRGLRPWSGGPSKPILRGARALVGDPSNNQISPEMPPKRHPQ